MHWIDNKLISDDILEEYFACALDVCKGACCWEGEFGAPLAEEEIPAIREAAALLRNELPEENRQVLDRTKGYYWIDELDKHGTALLENGACVFLGYDEHGVGQCLIEKAWREGRISFRKPISCHLYPIRVQEQEVTGMTILNYDRWSICSAACSRGKAEKIPLYRFAREAIVRAYGEEFYEALDAAAKRDPEAKE